MIKTLFIPAKVKSKLNKAKISEISGKLPKTIALAYSIQYQDISKQIKDILSKDHKITNFMQVLGCSKPKLSKSTQAILLIGSGEFHAISLAYATKLPIYILEQNNLYQVSKKDIENYVKKQKAAHLKFLNADKIGILISTKPGQQNLKQAINIKSKLKKQGKKKAYLFLADNINKDEFENFDVDSWINTACPRLDMDFGVVNISHLDLRHRKNSL